MISRYNDYSKLVRAEFFITAVANEVERLYRQLRLETTSEITSSLKIPELQIIVSIEAEEDLKLDGYDHVILLGDARDEIFSDVTVFDAHDNKLISNPLLGVDCHYNETNACEAMWQLCQLLSTNSMLINASNYSLCGYFILVTKLFNSYANLYNTNDITLIANNILAEIVKLSEISPLLVNDIGIIIRAIHDSNTLTDRINRLHYHPKLVFKSPLGEHTVADLHELGAVLASVGDLYGYGKSFVNSEWTRMDRVYATVYSSKGFVDFSSRHYTGKWINQFIEGLYIKMVFTFPKYYQGDPDEYVRSFLLYDNLIRFFCDAYPLSLVRKKVNENTFALLMAKIFSYVGYQKLILGGFLKLAAFTKYFPDEYSGLAAKAIVSSELLWESITEENARLTNPLDFLLSDYCRDVVLKLLNCFPPQHRLILVERIIQHEKSSRLIMNSSRGLIFALKTFTPIYPEFLEIYFMPTFGAWNRFIKAHNMRVDYYVKGDSEFGFKRFINFIVELNHEVRKAVITRLRLFGIPLLHFAASYPEGENYFVLLVQNGVDHQYKPRKFKNMPFTYLLIHNKSRLRKKSNKCSDPSNILSLLQHGVDPTPSDDFTDLVEEYLVKPNADTHHTISRLLSLGLTIKLTQKLIDQFADLTDPKVKICYFNLIQHSNLRNIPNLSHMPVCGSLEESKALAKNELVKLHHDHSHQLELNSVLTFCLLYILERNTMQFSRLDVNLVLCIIKHISNKIDLTVIRKLIATIRDNETEISQLNFKEYGICSMKKVDPNTKLTSFSFFVSSERLVLEYARRKIKLKSCDIATQHSELESFRKQALPSIKKHFSVFTLPGSRRALYNRIADSDLIADYPESVKWW